MLEIKAAIEVFEAEVTKRKSDIEALEPKGAAATPDESAKVTKLKADLSADVAIKRQFFLNEEARLYFDIYQSVAETVERLAKARDIGLVLRFNDDEMNPSKRESVLQGVNRAIVYRAVPDLTDAVLKELNGPKL
jgi:Skp family chaperone for outer membrane proteins